MSYEPTKAGLWTAWSTTKTELDRDQQVTEFAIKVGEHECHGIKYDVLLVAGPYHRLALPMIGEVFEQLDQIKRIFTPEPNEEKQTRKNHERKKPEAEDAD